MRIAVQFSFRRRQDQRYHERVDGRGFRQGAAQQQNGLDLAGRLRLTRRSVDGLGRGEAHAETDADDRRRHDDCRRNVVKHSCVPPFR